MLIWRSQVNEKRRAELQAAMRRGDYGALVRKGGGKAPLGGPLEEKTANLFMFEYDVAHNFVPRLMQHLEDIGCRHQLVRGKAARSEGEKFYMRDFLVIDDGKAKPSLEEVASNHRAEVIRYFARVETGIRPTGKITIRTGDKAIIKAVEDLYGEVETVRKGSL